MNLFLCRTIDCSLCGLCIIFRRLILKNFQMAVLKEAEAKRVQVKDGITRRVLHTKDLMMVVINFENGPWKDPDPLHHHVHEQITYVAEGELIFFCEGEPDQILTRGDVVSVPSGKKHAIQLLSKNAVLVDSFNPIREDFL
jgi:quercetin dioxygenase-like cupin family protein